MKIAKTFRKQRCNNSQESNDGVKKISDHEYVSFLCVAKIERAF